jgi:TusA-related sulfurtransferase
LSRKKELRKLSKGQLIEIILNQEDRIQKIEQYLKAFDNPHTPSSKKRKKNTNKDGKKNKNRFPGKPKGSKGGGIKLPKPDDIIEHELKVCPLTGLPLGVPIGFYKKTIIDFPDKPIQVIEHRIMRYLSPTGLTVTAQVDLPNGIYGNNLQSLTVMLKELTNSHKKIANFMRDLGAPSFSCAKVQAIADKFANKLEFQDMINLQNILKAPYVHCDETTFRKDGQNGYIWGVFTSAIAILRAKTSRARKNIIKILRSYKGVVVTDGYNAYDLFEFRQRCWSHLLRDAKDLAEKNDEIKVQHNRLKLLYDELKELNEGPPANEKDIIKVKVKLKDIVACLKAINGAKKLWTLIENGGDDWFTALSYEGVPLDNNLAERELRPIVLLRKTIGCYRNEKGQRWIDIVLSVMHTWRLQGLNLYQQLRVAIN